MDSQVSEFARSDAVHDFKENGPRGGDNLQLFNTSVPVQSSSKTAYDEDRCLEFVIGKDWKSKITAGPTPLTNKITVRAFSIDSDGPTLAKQIGFEGTGAAIVVDINQHGFVSKLKEGPTSGIPVYYILTSESFNDPGGKAPPSSRLFREPGGLLMKPLVEYRTTPVSYPGKRPFDLSGDARNLFFSNFTHTVSPIRDVSEGKIPRDLKVDLTITDEVAPPLVFPNSKKKNSITAALDDVVRGIKDLGSRALDYLLQRKVTTAWSRKRSGDWLQALSCITLKDRTFINVLEKTIQKIPNGVPTYFVTHDRIALAYALLVGCNVIFLSYEGPCYAFTQGVGAMDPEFFSKNIPPQTVLDQTVSFLQARVSELEGGFGTRSANLQGVLNDIQNAPSRLELQTRVRSIFTTLFEMRDILFAIGSHKQIIDGILGDDLGTKYTSYLLSESLKKTPFVIEDTAKKPEYIIASQWDPLNIQLRSLQSEAWKEEKANRYLFLDALSDFQTLLKQLVAAKFRDFATALKNEMQTGFKSPFLVNETATRTREALAVSIGSLAMQTYIYLRGEELEAAETLLFFSFHPMVSNVQEDILQTPDALPIFRDVSIAENKRRRDTEEDVAPPPTKRVRRGGNSNELHPASPIAVILIALESILPEIQESRDIALYGRLLGFLSALAQFVRTPDDRMLLWETLVSFNSTQDGYQTIAGAIGIPPQEYLVYSTLLSSLSYHVLGDLSDDDSYFIVKSIFERNTRFRTILQTAWQKSKPASPYTYESVVSSYNQLRKDIQFKLTPPLQMKTATPVPEQVITTKPTTISVSTGGKTYRKKSTRSKSSRHTKRVRRSDRAKKSEK